MSVSIEAIGPSASGHSEALTAPASVSGTDFGSILREFGSLDKKELQRLARINAFLRADRPAYPDPVGCRSWLVW